MSDVTREVFPLIWSSDVAAVSDWAVESLGLIQSWRADDEDGVAEHVELHWHWQGKACGKVSINISRDTYEGMGPSGISLRVDDVAAVDEIHAKAVAAGASITQGPEKSVIAYSFTAVDPDGNQWWVNAETGMLDQLRASGPTD
ncbi:MAG: VOC family protein [Pseudomonadota bacterium]